MAAAGIGLVRHDERTRAAKRASFRTGSLTFAQHAAVSPWASVEHQPFHAGHGLAARQGRLDLPVGAQATYSLRQTQRPNVRPHIPTRINTDG